jgi:hypothetical protein
MRHTAATITSWEDGMSAKKFLRRSIAIGILAGFAAGPVLASKVNMPKEGSFAFDFCGVTEAQTLSSGDKFFGSNFRGISNLHTDPPGGPFDRMSSICLGTYTNIKGHQVTYGVCEWTDQDGDKIWLEFKGSADGAGGTYTAPLGSGKYEGMTLNGEYILDFWPSATKEVTQGCNHNTGTYRLK